MKQMDMISKYKEYNGDFFPYIDKYDSYWSGFYTSKSCIKLYIRESGRFLQKVRNLGVLLRING
jgi:hypothetical protein